MKVGIFTARAALFSLWKTILFLCVFGSIAATSLPATTFKTLASFDAATGEGPLFGSLVQGFDGNFYGTTITAGANGEGGTVFRVTPAGGLTTVYSFCLEANCTDGNDASGGLALGTDGNFYGTTYNGGANCKSQNPPGCGTVFKITPGGTLTTLYSFCALTNCTDGYNPQGALVQGTDGNFYGTTPAGSSPANFGTVFKITPAGTLTTLYSFCSKTRCTDGENPQAGLVQGTDGNFYGTTYNGGTNGATTISGTVFKITPAGKLTTLYSFCSKPNCTDGYNPHAGLVQGTDGNFYGTTEVGGTSTACSGGCGTVFKITPGGKLTTLHSFDITDGRNPYAGLVQGTDRNFYGTTEVGGANFEGTIFKITSTGTLTTLYSFCSQTNCPDGDQPYAGLVQGTDGNFYGTTYSGGTGPCSPNACGTVFSLSVGLGPFVETLPTSGNVGATVHILGTNLAGASNVSFNSTAATFTVVSATEIETSVPSGATTGSVTVTTPTGTLKSNKIFRVTPQITNFSPSSGPVGTVVTINGDSFTGATSVTFGGVKAKSFTVDSYTQITVTVPSGAKTGRITVTTPGGTATSTGTFTVT